jgi:hypothetical protein
MPGLSIGFRVSLLCGALFVGASAIAQKGELSERLNDAKKQLQSDVQACKPINLGDYADLLTEAATNKQRALSAENAGDSIDETQANADFAKASSLFNQAQAAGAQQCLLPTQSQPLAPDIPAGSKGKSRA